MTIREWEGNTPQLGAGVYVDRSAVVIGRVILADDVSLWPAAVARGDVEAIRVGPRTNIQDGAVLHVTHDGPWSPGGRALEIGADVTAGHRVLLHACTIGDRCLLGMGAIVMDGAVLKKDVLLAAGSVVTPGKRLETASLYRGSPARFVRRLEPAEIEMLAYSAAHYVRLKNRYLVGG